MTHKSKAEPGKITAGFFDSYVSDFDSIYCSGKGLLHSVLTGICASASAGGLN